MTGVRIRYATKEGVTPGEWEEFSVVVKFKCIRLELEINCDTVYQNDEGKTSTARLYLNQEAHSSEYIGKTLFYYSSFLII